MDLSTFMSSVGSMTKSRLLICLKAPHGAGKSTIVSSLLHEPVEVTDGGKLPVLTYSPLMGIAALGQYRVGSTGCDGIKSTDAVKDLMSKIWLADVDVIYEGILPSIAMSTYHDHSASCGVRHGVLRNRLYVYIDVSKEDCIARIEQRRRQKYNMKPLNVASVSQKYDRIMKSISYYKDREQMNECRVSVVSGYGRPIRVANRVLSIIEEERLK